MRFLKRFFLVLLLILVLAAGVAFWWTRQPPPDAPGADTRWTALPANTPARLKVSFLGVATVLLDDGETAILTDGFFSRPDMLQSLVGTVQPDLAAIGRGMERAGIPGRTGKLAAVIPVHSHYDHAMDAPEVARRTGALLLGSESTANVGRGWRLPEIQLKVAKLGEPMQFGKFTVTLWPGAHAPTGFTGGEITEPLKPPVRAFAYREGQTYAVHIVHEGRSLLINGSAGFAPGALQKVQADVVLLGIGTLGTQDAAYHDAYWREVVQATGARRVVPIHWDNFWIPSEQPMRPMPVPLDRFDLSMAFLRARGTQTGVDVRLPLQWQAMDLWQDLPVRPAQ